jgi:hypothetical protein
LSNWGGQSKPGSGGDWFERARPAYLIVVTVALLALGVAFVFSDRYAIGQAGPMPARLDRLTGQVIACVPPRGCFELIPAGKPQLGTVTAVPKAAAPPAGSPAPGAK